MNEQDYIAAQDWKNRAALRRELAIVKRTGWPSSRSMTETLIIAGWIVFSPPRHQVQLKGNNHRYNHYRLTESGQWQFDQS